MSHFVSFHQEHACILFMILSVSRWMNFQKVNFSLGMISFQIFLRISNKLEWSQFSYTLLSNHLWLVGSLTVKKAQCIRSANGCIGFMILPNTCLNWLEQGRQDLNQPWLGSSVASQSYTFCLCVKLAFQSSQCSFQSQHFFSCTIKIKLFLKVMVIDQICFLLFSFMHFSFSTLFYPHSILTTGLRVWYRSRHFVGSC